jgi:hypothetical protein
MLLMRPFALSSQTRSPPTFLMATKISITPYRFDIFPFTDNEFFILDRQTGDDYLITRDSTSAFTFSTLRLVSAYTIYLHSINLHIVRSFCLLGTYNIMAH